jgi:hypothetical protein
VNGALNNRGKTVRELLRNAGVTPYKLDLSADGHPVHPLYQPYELKPTEWRL